MDRDALPKTFEAPQGFGVMLNLNEPAGSERIFEALSEKGTVAVTLQETSWAHRPQGPVPGSMGDQW